MFEKARSGRDAFTFSLNGMKAIASFTPVSMIVDDRINRSIDERLKGSATTRGGAGRSAEWAVAT